MNIIEIFTAWTKLLNPSVTEKELAEERLAICNTCNYKLYVSELRMFVCDGCNCPIHAKVYSNKNNCPLNKWKR
jgi:hypothetical protein